MNMDAEKWLTDNYDWDYELMFRRGEIDLGDALDLMEEYAKYYYQSKVNNGVLDDVSQRYTIEDIEKCVENWGLCKVEKEYIEKFLNGG